MKINVLLATRNRAFSLKRTLDSFMKLETKDLSWKLIVIDNGSDDTTMEILQKFSQHLPLTILTEKRPGKNIALNKALEIIDGEWIVFTDDDIIVNPLWLQELVEATLRWPKYHVFGGKILPLMPPETPKWIAEIDEDTKCTAFAKYSPDKPEGPIDQAPYGANFAVRGSIMKKFKYNEQLGPKVCTDKTNYISGGETDLLHRLKNQNFAYVYVPKAEVQHVIRSNQVCFEWLCRRYYFVGRGFAHYQKLTCPFIFGVPYFVWIQWVTQSLKYILCSFCSQRKKFEIAKKLYWTRGAISEYLKLSRLE